MKVQVERYVSKAISLDEEETTKLSTMCYIIESIGARGIENSFGHDKDFGNSRCTYSISTLEEIVAFAKKINKDINDAK